MALSIYHVDYRTTDSDGSHTGYVGVCAASAASNFNNPMALDMLIEAWLRAGIEVL